MEKRILFAGAYGIENAGDDLPLLVMCEQLREIAPDINFEFKVLTRHYNKWEEDKYGVKFIKNLEYHSRKDAEGKWFNGLNFGDDKANLLRIMDEIKKSDLLILGAGNFFIDIVIDVFRGPIPLYAIYVFFAKLYHTKIMLYGASAGPITTNWGKDLSRWIVENSDVVTVRDKESKEELLKLLYDEKEIIVLPDSTIGVKKIDKKNLISIFKKEDMFINGKKTVALALRDLNGIVSTKKADKIFKLLVNIMNELKDECEFVFVPQSTYKEDDDRIIAEKIINDVDNDTECYSLDERLDPWYLANLYSLFDLTIAIRLHGAVFSAISGTPVVAINYLPKVGGFMNGMGMGDFLVDIGSAKEENLLLMIRNILKSDEISINFIQSIQNNKEKVQQYPKLAFSLLRDKV